MPADQDRRTHILGIIQPRFVSHEIFFWYWKSRLVNIIPFQFLDFSLRPHPLCHSALRYQELGHKGLVSFGRVGYLWHVHMLWEDVDRCVFRTSLRWKRGVGYEDGSLRLVLASISPLLRITCITSKYGNPTYIHQRTSHPSRPTPSNFSQNSSLYPPRFHPHPQSYSPNHPYPS